MTRAYTGDLWWKTAVISCIDVESYSDSDGDGVDRRLGTHGDVVEFFRTAEPRHPCDRRSRRERP